MSTFDDAMDSMMEQVTQVMGTTVKLWKPGTIANPNFTTGVRSVGDSTAYTIKANQAPVRQETVVQEAGGSMVITVTPYEIRLADLSGQTPSREWRLGASDSTWDTADEIIDVQFDANSKGVVLLVGSKP